LSLNSVCFGQCHVAGAKSSADSNKSPRRGRPESIYCQDSPNSALKVPPTLTRFDQVPTPLQPGRWFKTPLPLMLAAPERIVSAGNK